MVLKCRKTLNIVQIPIPSGGQKKISYPLLVACYNRGPDFVRKKQFDIEEIGETPNQTYQELFKGNLAPLNH